MINAYQSGSPGNGKPFPDGSKMAKIHWNPKKLETFPSATLPASLHDVDFMVKDRGAEYRRSHHCKSSPRLASLASPASPAPVARNSCAGFATG